MTESVYQDLQTKLHAIYPSTENSWSELWRAYWNDAARGNNGGVPLWGDALVAHFASHGSGAGFLAGLTAFASYLDATGPVLSVISSGTPGTTTATITWTSGEAATSKVDYGATNAYGSSTTLDATLVTSHSVGLSGLTDNATYHYRVRSKDAQGNETVSSDGTFVTQAAVVTLINDTFTAADATNPDGRTPSPTNTPGNTWVRDKNTWRINSNRLDNNSAADSVLSIQPGVNDYTVEFDLTTGTSINAGWFGGVIVRMTSGNILTGAIAYYDMGVGGGSYVIGGGGENVSPVYTSAAEALVAATAYHWKVVCLAGVVDLYVDSVLKLHATGTTTSANMVGLIEYHTANTAHFDNFKVTVP